MDGRPPEVRALVGGRRAGHRFARRDPRRPGLGPGPRSARGASAAGQSGLGIESKSPSGASGGGPASASRRTLVGRRRATGERCGPFGDRVWPSRWRSMRPSASASALPADPGSQDRSRGDGSDAGHASGARDAARPIASTPPTDSAGGMTPCGTMSGPPAPVTRQCNAPPGSSSHGARARMSASQAAGRASSSTSVAGAASAPGASSSVGGAARAPASSAAPDGADDPPLPQSGRWSRGPARPRRRRGRRPEISPGPWLRRAAGTRRRGSCSRSPPPVRARRAAHRATRTARR